MNTIQGFYNKETGKFITLDENSITEGEFYFFKKIKKDCKIIFDVGCRYDTFYIELSKSKNFYLFEPNPFYYMTCKRKLENIIILNEIRLENFGLGNKTEEKIYWEDSRSFFQRNKKLPFNTETIILPIKKFTEYIEEEKIEKIDFLKIDVEGCEPDILLDNPEYIKNNIRYIQFEWATTWNDRDDNINLCNIFDIYEKNFLFYYLFNSEHPLSIKTQNMMSQISDKSMIKNILNKYFEDEYGFEIAMIRK